MSNERGFTFIEIMTVVLIIAILTAISMPVYGKVLIKARNVRDLANERTGRLYLLAGQLDGTDGLSGALEGEPEGSSGESPGEEGETEMGLNGRPTVNETETPMTEAPVTETPITETPMTEVPITETPMTEAPSLPAQTMIGTKITTAGKRTATVQNGMSFYWDGSSLNFSSGTVVTVVNNQFVQGGTSGDVAATESKINRRLYR